VFVWREDAERVRERPREGETKGKPMPEVALLLYLAAIVAVALGLTAALWIGVIFMLGFVAVFAFAWATK
jgi:hypothetical protein